MAVDLSAADGPAQLIQRATEEHGQVDVLVNNVGAVRMRTEGFLGTSDEDFAWAMQMNFFTAGIGGFATGRFTTPEEVAALITFLASSKAGNITGVNYVIDGGLIKTT